MGREVRMVPPDWQHPKNERGHFIPLFEGTGGVYANRAAEWDEEYSKWQEGFVRSYADPAKPWRAREPSDGDRFTEWTGQRPSPDDYMPDWAPEVATHLMMYEDTSEGTPISPAFATPEELARWLASNGASAFGDMRATYDQWLSMINRGWAPSAIVIGGALMSGVAGLPDQPTGEASGAALSAGEAEAPGGPPPNSDERGEL